MLTKHFEHWLDIHWLMLILKDFTSRHIFLLNFYWSRLYARSCLAIYWLPDANQSWIPLTEKTHSMRWCERDLTNHPVHPHSIFHPGLGIEREVIHSGKKAEQRTGQKWDLLIPFPLYVFRVAFNFRLGHQCPYPVGCHFWFAFCALSPFAKDVCLGHIFPGAVMGQHWAHCNFFIISVEQDPAFWKVYP